MYVYLTRTFKYNSAILAGALALPGMYTFRFLLAGRGHATEFPEAQSALGFSYSGHAFDWIFLSILLMGIFVWIYRAKPSYKIAGRLAFGCVLTIIFVLGLQAINNAIFDPVFETM